MDIGQNHFKRGEVLFELHRYTEALEEFHKALIYYPNDTELHFRIAKTHYALNDFDNALLYSDKLITLAPDNRAGYALKAITLMLTNKHTSKSLKSIEDLFKTSIELDPNDEVTWSHFSKFYYHLGRFEDALEASEKAIAISPSNIFSLNRKILALGRLGRYEEAEECSQLALSLDPNSPLTYVSKGQNELLKKDANSAEGAFMEALRLSPQFAEATQGLKEVEKLRKEPKENMIIGCIAWIIILFILFKLIKWLFF
ncbi:MAG: tetratricopeptide repeat protein [Saprospiraceae bacterium]|nr:tetratricopeptide repeat protein [Saprospiraceae bacterium]